MALAVVQHQSGIHTSQVPGSVTLGTAPTTGNLLVCLLGVNILRTNLHLNTTDWTMFQQVGDPTYGTVGIIMVGVYRYVQPGDTAILPAFCTSGTTYWTHCIWEISGVTGNWDDDLLFCGARAEFQNSYDDPQAALTAYPVLADTLALTGGAAYNGNGNPSITGTWTLDESGNNNANYGSVGGAHRNMVAGDIIDGAWTLHNVGSNPYAAMVLAFTTQPPASPYPRNFWMFDSFSAGHPTTPTVPFTPETGHLLIAILGWDGVSANPTFDSNWTIFKTQLGASTDYKVGLYRYVQPGDTATLPNICTAGSSVYSLQVLEISGVTGTFSTDVPQVTSGFQQNATPFPIAGGTTSQPNQFAFISYGEFASTSIATISAGWTSVQTFSNNLDYGNDAFWFQYYPTSGSTVSASITPGVLAQPQGFIGLLLSTFIIPPPPTSGNTFQDAMVWG